MANYAVFYRSNNDLPPDFDDERVTVSEAKYAIPAFWFTVFDHSSLRLFEDPDDELELPFLVVAKQDAIEELRARLERFESLFVNASGFFDEWRGMLEGLREKYLKADVFEVVEMSTDKDELPMALRFLTQPTTEHMDAFFALTGLPEILDEQGRILTDTKPPSGYSALQRLIGVGVS